MAFVDPSRGIPFTVVWVGGVAVMLAEDLEPPQSLRLRLDRIPRRLHVEWASYCEEQSDDGYTESYTGKLSGVGRITYYPHVFDGATTCDVWINASPVKGARVVAGVFSY